MRKINFNECPRPQLVRDSYIILDGKWEFRFDDSNTGEERNFFNGFESEYEINVPFTYQTKKSGVNIQRRCDYVWYQRIINVSKRKNMDLILHLEGADYLTKVYVNGRLAGADTGAYHRLSFNITDYLKDGDNLIVIKCEDDYSLEKPRGKQRWKDESFECWYIDTTGIYKTVWLEECPVNRIEDFKITPYYHNKTVKIEYLLKESDGLSLTTEVMLDDELVVKSNSIIEGDKLSIELDLSNNFKPWDIASPNLYDLNIKLSDGDNDIDIVKSYFGLRAIDIKNGKIYLNDKELYQKLILDQGYYEETDLTAPNTKALYSDIMMMKEYGFNGCRKHQKIEDERFAYYCDVLGFLMWCEMPAMYANTIKSRACFEREWLLAVKENYNHPAIIVWTPLNESWGVWNIKNNKVEQDFANLVYHLTKEYDSYRPVITNDGWEHTISDIITIHHYEQDGKKLASYFKTVDKTMDGPWGGHFKETMAEGYKYNGQPIMFTEFGGTAYVKNIGNGNWGYGAGVNSDEEYINRICNLIESLHGLAYSCGYCYTQLSDVKQEVNGLLDNMHRHKVDPKKIKISQDKRN